MSALREPGVCVIIAAYNAQETIERAVRSALAQPEAEEVVVVDDASLDHTVARLQVIDDPRLSIVRLNENGGPAAARNRALSLAKSEFVTVLDSDDYMLPDRLAGLTALAADADFVADDLWLAAEADSDAPTGALIGLDADAVSWLTLTGFVNGNMGVRGAPRRELGFLKPLMRRAFLTQHRLSYDSALRLGEDYVLYARALLCGARIKLVGPKGYVAVVRSGSLSGSHRTADLLRLSEACRELWPMATDPSAARALKAHGTLVRRRALHRAMLDAKREGGITSAAALLLSHLADSPHMVWAVLQDKLASAKP